MPDYAGVIFQTLSVLYSRGDFDACLKNLRDAVLSIDVPNIEPFPEPEPLPDLEEQSEWNELPF